MSRTTSIIYYLLFFLYIYYVLLGFNYGVSKDHFKLIKSFFNQKFRFADSEVDFDDNIEKFKERFEPRYPEYVKYIVNTYLKEYRSF